MLEKKSGSELNVKLSSSLRDRISKNHPLSGLTGSSDCAASLLRVAQ